VSDAVVVSTLGEAMLRLSVPSGDRLADAAAYDVHVAGSEANVAYALARTGVPARWASALPRNTLGSRVAETLAGGGVDTSAIHWSSDGRLGTYFVEFSPLPRPTHVVYDRRGSAFATARPEDFNWERICDATAFHISGISFAVSASAAAVSERALEEASRRGLFVSYDVNHRMLLSSPKEAADTVARVAPLLDLLVCRAEDAHDLFGENGDAEQAALSLRERFGIETVVVTDGAVGAVGADGSSVVARPAYPVEAIVERIGAGDAFVAGLLAGMLQGSLGEGLERGLAMAALKLTLRGDLFRLPVDQIAALRAGHSRQISR
jgi:2-dehydro-3-deoxygluconokinase